MSQVEQVRPIDDVVRAVKTAQQFLQTLMPDQARDLLLEEVEALPEEHPREWRVTFSVPSPTGRGPTIAALTGDVGLTREYKTITIDAETGSFRSMKIRTI